MESFLAVVAVIRLPVEPFVGPFLEISTSNRSVVIPPGTAVAASGWNDDNSDPPPRPLFFGI